MKFTRLDATLNCATTPQEVKQLFSNRYNVYGTELLPVSYKIEVAVSDCGVPHLAII